MIDAINNNPNDQSLGEEIRALQQGLFIDYVVSGDELEELLFVLIVHTPNDYELGGKIRRLKNKIIEYYN